MNTIPTRQDFEAIYNDNGTCTNWWCGKQGVVLAYDTFSPEVAHWFCPSCWQDDEDGLPFLDIVEDHRQREVQPDVLQ